MLLNDGLEDYHEIRKIHFYYYPRWYYFMFYRMYAASNQVLEDGMRNERWTLDKICITGF